MSKPTVGHSGVLRDAKFVYPSVWPSSTLEGTCSMTSYVVCEIVSVVLVFCFSIFRGFFEAAIRSVMEQTVAINGAAGHLAVSVVGPLVIGLVSAGSWFVLYMASVRVTGGHLTGLDTIALAIHGYIGRVPTKKYSLMAYGWNWIKCVLFIAAIWVGLYLGALISRDMVKLNPDNGAMLPHASLSDREGFYFLLPLLTGTLYVALRLYLANPFVDVTPSAPVIVAALIGLTSTIGAYIGNNGHYDFLLPLAIAASTSGSLKFFGYAVLGWAGALLAGILVFHVHALQHVMQNNIFGNLRAKFTN